MKVNRGVVVLLVVIIAGLYWVVNRGHNYKIDEGNLSDKDKAVMQLIFEGYSDINKQCQSVQTALNRGDALSAGGAAVELESTAQAYYTAATLTVADQPAVNSIRSQFSDDCNEIANDAQAIDKGRFSSNVDALGSYYNKANHAADDIYNLGQICLKALHDKNTN